jgi:uncharacterized protein YvpB
VATKENKNVQIPLRQLNRKLMTTAVGILGVVIAACALAYFHQQVKAQYHLSDIRVGSPISVSFTRPSKSDVKYQLSPELDGSWRISRNFFGITGISFVPSRKLVPGSVYSLKIANVTPVLASHPSIENKIIRVTVERPAAVAAVEPGPGAANVPVAAVVKVRLEEPSGGLRELRLQADAPLVSAEPESRDDKLFEWKFSSPLNEGQTYHISVLDLKQKGTQHQTLVTSSFTTVPEPHITSATNRDHFYPGDSLSLTFDQDMKPTDSDFSFGFSGQGHWQDARNYVFVPTGLKPGQIYRYSVAKGAESVNGGLVEAQHDYQISTPGVVFVAGASPNGGNVAINSTISITFDQPVDHNSAQAAFSLTPGVPGNFTWSGNSMIYQAGGLTYQSTYVVSLSKGIKSVYGLDSTVGWSNQFTTTYEIVKLNVPYFKQVYALSCEEAALRMALAYRGINVSENDIIVRENYNPRPRDTATNSWDDPYQMYVGNVNGVMGVSGWGVYSPPVAAAARGLGRNATAVTGITINQIAQAIHDGNPVVLWGINGPTAKVDSWNTGSGVVQAPKNEHARTVYGVAGSASNPVGFYLHDPVYGDVYWSVAQMQWNMSFGGTQPSQAVIVY